jgi:glycosyltransferase involved in cell wall biosynthesis
MNIRIGVLSTFGEKGNYGFLGQLVSVLSEVCEEVIVIAPNTRRRLEGNVRYLSVSYDVGSSVPAQVFNQALLQARMSSLLARHRRRADCWLFFDAETLLLPVLTVKVLGQKLALAMAGSLEQEAKYRRHALHAPQLALKRVACALADRIVLYSERLIADGKLTRYRPKIVVADRHYLDLDAFKSQRDFGQRENVVGFVGRLSEEKGVLNLLAALPAILAANPDTSFLIAGDGPLRERVEECVAETGSERLKFAGWVSHEDLPKYFSLLRLLVLPSYTEGMPNVMLEAMACGTPVVATSVGGIPDVIRDGDTGFLMKDNHPDSIAASVARALANPNLERVAASGREQVCREFSFSAAVSRYRALVNELGATRLKSRPSADGPGQG